MKFTSTHFIWSTTQVLSATIASQETAKKSMTVDVLHLVSTPLILAVVDPFRFTVTWKASTLFSREEWMGR